MLCEYLFRKSDPLLKADLFSIFHLLNCKQIYNNCLERLKELDSGWKKKNIEIDIASMDQHQLDQWKRDAQPWPAFLSKETQEAAMTVLHCVEEALSRQRLNYIVSLIDQLTAEEKEKLLKMLKS